MRWGDAILACTALDVTSHWYNHVVGSSLTLNCLYTNWSINGMMLFLLVVLVVHGFIPRSRPGFCNTWSRKSLISDLLLESLWTAHIWSAIGKLMDCLTDWPTIKDVCVLKGCLNLCFKILWTGSLGWKALEQNKDPVILHLYMQLCYRYRLLYRPYRISSLFFIFIYYFTLHCCITMRWLVAIQALQYRCKKEIGPT